MEIDSIHKQKRVKECKEVKKKISQNLTLKGFTNTINLYWQENWPN